MSAAELIAQFFAANSFLTLLLPSKLLFSKQIRACGGVATSTMCCTAGTGLGESNLWFEGGHTRTYATTINP